MANVDTQPQHITPSVYTSPLIIYYSPIPFTSNCLSQHNTAHKSKISKNHTNYPDVAFCSDWPPRFVIRMHASRHCITPRTYYDLKSKQNFHLKHEHLSNPYQLCDRQKPDSPGKLRFPLYRDIQATAMGFSRLIPNAYLGRSLVGFKRRT